MAYCHNCAASIEGNTTFCSSCGARLGTTAAGGVGDPVGYSSGAVVAAKSNPNVLLGILSFVIPIVGFILGIVFIAKPTQVDKYTGKLCLGISAASVLLAIVMSVMCAVALEKATEDLFSAPGVEVVEYELTAGSGLLAGKSVVGTAVNNSDEDYSYLTIEFNLYDSDGVLVGNTSDRIQNFSPGDTWRFEASVYDAEVDSAEVSDISGW